VATHAPAAVPVAAVSRAAYKAAGVNTGEDTAGPDRQTGKRRAGGRVGGVRRPSDTQRDPWRTLVPGMRRAVSPPLINRGIEPVLLDLLGERPPMEVYDRINEGLNAHAREYYHGEVWPLRGVFGVLSRFPAVLVDGSGAKLTPTVVTTWLTDSGKVSCSCVGRVAFVARHGEVPVDGVRQHARTFRGAIDYVSSRLCVPLSTFRRVVPALFSAESADDVVALRVAATASDTKLDWDADGPIESFRTGQTAVAVFLLGIGFYRVPTPMGCARKTSTCLFCDSAAGFSCVHAIRARSVRRGPSDKDPVAADGNGAGGTDGDSNGGVAADDARSTEPLSLYNCPRSVRADVKVCRAMEDGEVFALRAPSCCPTCGSAKTKENSKVDSGEVLCSLGYAVMTVESFYCDEVDCKRWIFPNGRDAGVVIQSCTTTATLVLMCDMAGEMVTSGSTFRSFFVH